MQYPLPKAPSWLHESEGQGPSALIFLLLCMNILEDCTRSPCDGHSFLFEISHLSSSHISYGITFNILQTMTFFPGKASNALENSESIMSGPDSERLELNLANKS